MQEVDLNRYKDFVDAVTSDASNNIKDFTNRVQSLAESTTVNIPLIMTAAVGLGSESGEFAEVVKKIVFQGKPLNEDAVFHMKRELGDIIWYWTNACRALGLDPNDVVAENVSKLEARYPGGKFNVARSEVRKDGDI